LDQTIHIHDSLSLLPLESTTGFTYLSQDQVGD
jgi:hypothetical protein